MDRDINVLLAVVDERDLAAIWSVECSENENDRIGKLTLLREQSDA